LLNVKNSLDFEFEQLNYNYREENEKFEKYKVIKINFRLKMKEDSIIIYL